MFFRLRVNRGEELQIRIPGLWAVGVGDIHSADAFPPNAEDPAVVHVRILALQSQSTFGDNFPLVRKPKHEFPQTLSTLNPNFPTTILVVAFAALLGGSWIVISGVISSPEPLQP